MATFNITVPDALLPEINAIVAAQGFPNTRAWIISILRGYLVNERVRKGEVRPDRETIKTQVEADLP